MKRHFFLLLAIPTLLLGGKVNYLVKFEGLDDGATLRTIKSVSQLVALKKKAPASVNALRYRAESDLPEMERVLQASGYLEAHVGARIEEREKEYLVLVEIDPGPLYMIEKVEIEPPVLTMEELGLCEKDPADTRCMIDGELRGLHLLSERGYPLAHIVSREIIADGETKTVVLELKVETGPLAAFGETSIGGNKTVRNRLIEQQILWCEGDRYDSCLVEETQQELMDTGLFTSVYITHAEELNPGGQLPMKVEVAEAKHRTIGIGASYQTTYGGGGSFGWENRNIGGMGRRLTLQADIAQRSHSGVLTYLVPNFHRVGQSYIVQALASHEAIKPYHKQSYSLLNRFDRQWGECFYFSVGPRVEYMMVTSSVDNGNFLLVEVPLYLRWSNVADPLNPLCGLRFEYWGTPALNIKDVNDFYYSQMASLCTYWNFGTVDTLVLAQKLTVGTIFSNGLNAIPVPNRFFGGSEENLRGYKYLTVSPLTNTGKPIGGRSAVFYTVEPRFRLSESFGLVPFFDIGKVYEESLPTLKGKWRKSTGIGLRYFSFIGPLRLDLAFPLDKRKKVDDPNWWVFVSLGQTF